jgi:hypothetical protein
MKIIFHKSTARGYADHGWLQTYHTFSFAGYHDPERIRFGLLRVLNDDTVQPGMGFGMHPHDNMEIVTIPLQGSLAHRDSMGNEEVIHAGEVQVMSAGTGLYHSEYNASQKDHVSLLQIWVFPKVRDVKPRYAQKLFDIRDRINKFQTVVSPDKTEGKLWLNQDVYFSLGNFTKNQKVNYKIKHPGNGAYIFVIEGSVIINGEKLNRRDGLGLEEADKFEIEVKDNSEILIIDVPMN